MKRAERLYALTEMLRQQGRRGCTAQRLATEFAVTVRTVKRDLAALQSAGVPIWSKPGPGGGYGLTEGTTLPPITLTAPQAVAVLAAAAAAGDAPFSDLARAGLRKILDVLEPSTRERASELAARVWVNPAPSPPRSVMSSLEAAMADQVIVRIRYQDREGALTDRDVEPVLFASSSGRWYLIGWCRLRDGIRWFDLHRIHRAVATHTACTGHTIDEVGEPPEGARSALPVLG